MNPIERFREWNSRHDLEESGDLAKLRNRELTDLFISTRNRRGWASNLAQTGFTAGIVGITVNFLSANYISGVITDLHLMGALTLTWLWVDVKISNRMRRITTETKTREARLLAVLKY